ncbi:MAG: DUF5058 family protein [Firmicutes bacterium]|nr:DUF5058 family protein [Bacillota bacterium]
MVKEHLALANSSTMLISCAVAMLVVLMMPLLFYRKSVKRAKEIGMPEEQIKQITKVSGLFAIIPSLPILISYVALMPSLGQYYPWLRLSVVGAAGYETLAADMAAKSMGYETISTASFDYSGFIVVMLVTALAILGGNLFNMTILPFYDQKVKTMQASGSTVVPVITGVMFFAMYAVMSTPYVTNIANPVQITTLLIAGIVALLVGKAAQTNKKLKEWVFPISLLSGMASACIIAPLLA